MDDATLLAVEHALGGSLVLNEDDEHVLVGADYSLSQLLDFMAGTTGDDPNEEVLDEGLYGGPRIVVDSRIHYHEHDIIRALVTEVRRLRGES